MFMTITAIMCQKFLHNNNDSKTIQTVDTTTVKTNRRKNHDHRHGRLSSKKRRSSSSSSSSSRRKKHHRSTTTLPLTNNMAATTTISDSQRKSSSIRYPQHDNNRKLSSLSSTKLLQTKNIQLPIQSSSSTTTGLSVCLPPVQSTSIPSTNVPRILTTSLLLQHKDNIDEKLLNDLVRRRKHDDNFIDIIGFNIDNNNPRQQSDIQPSSSTSTPSTTGSSSIGPRTPQLSQ